jgi:hypothetical protein
MAAMLKDSLAKVRAKLSLPDGLLTEPLRSRGTNFYCQGIGPTISALVRIRISNDNFLR